MSRDVEVGFDRLVDLAGDGSFEAAKDLFVRFLVGGAFVAVGLGARVVSESNDSDPAEGRVCSSVTAAVQPVPIGFAR